MMRFVNGAPCFFAMLALCACERYPESYAPPPQRPSFEDPERWERVIRMTDVDAPDHFLAGINNFLAINWRLTGKRPLVRLDVPTQLGFVKTRFKYHLEFGIPQASFGVNGPETLSFLVNGNVLDRMRYAAAGLYTFEKDVPQEWISGGYTTVGAEIDKTFVSREDGRTYGFILVAIGLKRN